MSESRLSDYDVTRIAVAVANELERRSEEQRLEKARATLTFATQSNREPPGCKWCRLGHAANEEGWHRIRNESGLAVYGCAQWKGWVDE